MKNIIICEIVEIKNLRIFIYNLPSYERFDLVPNCIVSFDFLTVLPLYEQKHHNYPKIDFNYIKH